MTTTVQDQINSTVERIPRGLAIRGVIAIVFGLAVLVWPNITLQGLTLIVGAFALVDGVASLVLAFSPMLGGARFWLVINGIAGLIVGVFVFVQPSLSELALLYVVGAYAIALGAIQFVVALTAPIEGRYRFLLFVYSAFSVVFGAIMFVRPDAGAVGLVSLISAYAIVTGITLVAAAMDFRSASNDVKTQIASAMSNS
jgi:uncharacterized membrane protein HdeD (DUF308 family)